MSALDAILHARTGPMTSDLVQRPGDFGLGLVPARLAPAGTTTSICGFCSTGCSLKIHLNAAGEAINLSPDPAYPVNLGMACPKGWEALAPLTATDRLTMPLLRNPASGKLEPVSWDIALAAFTENFRRIHRTHGGRALSFLSTGQIVMEEMALLGALAKFGMGMVDVDSNTRQCMATSHVAYKQSFGFDAPPFTYADFEESDALIFIGANPCIAHPIMWQRVMMNRRSPEIVVIDPRRTETALAATLHVPLRPKSDLTLLYGLARLLLDRGAIKQSYLDAHTENFPAFRAFLADFPLARIVTETGLPAITLHRLAEIIATRERVSFWWTMGVNQSHEATRTAQAIINLALMTGNVGRPGTGANSITGQCNAMGSRLFGNATSLLGGYDFSDPAQRAHVAAILELNPDLIPNEKSRAYDEILDAIDRREIRGLWVIATNPAHSWINQNRIGPLREKLDFLVVQDMYATTETAQMADLVLPAAGWGEKEGIFINSERRLGVIRKVARAPGQALSDFAIFKLVAESWGCGDLFRQWSSPEATFQLLKKLSAAQPCDFSGIRDYAHLEQARGIQWPFPAADAVAWPTDDCRLPIADCRIDSALRPIANRQSPIPSPERRLFADGRFFTPSGRAYFHFDAPRPVAEPTDAGYPFTLLTGRGTSAQWHTGSRTDKSDVLRKLAPRACIVEIHPTDAAAHRITAGQSIQLRSRRGTCTANAVITATVQPGHLFVPMHWPDVNKLTFPAFDPHSRQPSYKFCAVTISK